MLIAHRVQRHDLTGALSPAYWRTECDAYRRSTDSLSCLSYRQDAKSLRVPWTKPVPTKSQEQGGQGLNNTKPQSLIFIVIFRRLDVEL